MICTGGRDCKVTNANKREYVDMHPKWRVSRGTDEQMKRFLFGLNEIISLDLLKTFDPQEMEVRPPLGGLCERGWGLV